jgi:hypothetical protein
MKTHRNRLLAWLIFGTVIAVACGVKHYPIVLTLSLPLFWLIAAAWSIYASPGWRGLSALLVLASTIPMKITFLYVLLSMAAARGHVI